jgi:CheY-like chemotaxis protein
MAQLLVIDDDTACRELVLRVLGPHGHSVTMAENGAIGLEKLAQTNMDLVITDLHMPEMEGFQVIQVLRRLLPNLKIIAVSGTNPRDLKAALALGANAVIRKPYDLSNLRETVAKLLSESSADRTPGISTQVIDAQRVRGRPR